MSNNTGSKKTGSKTGGGKKTGGKKTGGKKTDAKKTDAKKTGAKLLIVRTSSIFDCPPAELEADLRSKLRKGRRCRLEHQLPDFHRTMSDVAYTQFERIAYLERITQCAEPDVEWTDNPGNYAELHDYVTVLSVEFTVRDVDALVRFLVEDVSPSRHREDKYYDPLPMRELELEVISRVADGDLDFRYPELVDDAMSDYVNGALREELGDDPWDDLPRGWGIGFWRSCVFGSQGVTAYTSNRYVVYFPGCNNLPSLKKVARIVTPSTDIARASLILDLQRKRLVLIKGQQLFAVDRGLLHSAVHDICECLSVQFPGLVMAKQVLVCARSELLYLGFEDFAVAVMVTRCGMGDPFPLVKRLLPPPVVVDWGLVIDDDFEVIAYDYLVYRGFEDVRKMGRSRSTDGGRDLTGRRAPLGSHRIWDDIFWVCQCKKTPRGATAYTKIWGSIADVVLRYGAKGYVAVTNGIIDSKFIDKLEDFKQRGVLKDYVTCSVYELERFMSEHASYFDRYLKKRP